MQTWLHLLLLEVTLTQKEKNMKKILLALMCVLVVGCVPTRITTKYSGDAAASRPYVELTTMDSFNAGCDRFTKTCSYFINITPKVHNPTKGYVEGVLRCDFSLDDYVASKYKSTIMKIAPKKSVMESITRGVEAFVGQRATLSAQCYYKYRKALPPIKRRKP